MKKAKLIPNILMLVLCISILAVGIYAASPTSHSVVGTVKISAGGANVRITAYLDDGDGDYKDDVKVSDTYTSRTAQTINIYANALDFDCSSASDIAQVAEKKLYFKVENLSSFSLGAYFLQGTVGANGTEESNIAESKNFNGTMGAQTINNLITATFTPYTEVPVKDSAYMYSTLKLNQLNSEASTVTLNLNLNIEKLNEGLLPKNLISVVNSSNLNVTIDCSVENASTVPTATITKSGRWQSGELAFAGTKYGNGELRLKTIKMKMLVTNNDSKPVSVTITEGSSNTEQTDVKVSVLGNSYIAPGATEEISVQFAAVYTRSETPLTTAPIIGTYDYIVNVTAVEEVTTADILALIDYDATGIANGRLHYFIPFGDNPYVAGEKLRWFIWAKDDGNGKPTALVAGKDYNGTNFLGGGTYYFISEYTLDVSKSDSQSNLVFSNEFDWHKSNKNFEGNNVSDYAGSNLRSYLNGLTVRSYLYDADYDNSGYDMGMPTGAYCNFYEEFKLTNSPIFSKISARGLENLYDTGANNNVNTFPSAYAGQTDKFWALSNNDWSFLTNSGNDYTKAVAYYLSTGTSNSASSWWLRSPFASDFGYHVSINGSYSNAFDVYDCNSGVRPAFQIQI